MEINSWILGLFCFSVTMVAVLCVFAPPMDEE
jgi:hypothetical protein